MAKKRVTRRKHVKCSGRPLKTCRRAKKRCTWAKGSKRSFCRRSKSRRH
jgi:hypothetical protein